MDGAAVAGGASLNTISSSTSEVDVMSSAFFLGYSIFCVVDCSFFLGGRWRGRDGFSIEVIKVCVMNMGGSTEKRRWVLSLVYKFCVMNKRGGRIMCFTSLLSSVR